MHPIVTYNPGLPDQDRLYLEDIIMTKDASLKKAARARGSAEGKKLTTTFNPAQSTLDRLMSRIDEGWDGNSRSVRLEKDLTTYWKVLDYGLLLAKHALTKNEAKLILDAQNGAYWDASQIGMYINGGLTLNISDAIKLNGYDEKWEVDGPAMIDKLQNLNGLAVLALIDWARQFWAHHETIDLDTHVNGFQDV